MSFNLMIFVQMIFAINFFKPSLCHSDKITSIFNGYVDGIANAILTALQFDHIVGVGGCNGQGSIRKPIRLTKTFVFRCLDYRFLWVFNLVLATLAPTNDSPRARDRYFTQID